MSDPFDPTMAAGSEGITSGAIVMPCLYEARLTDEDGVGLPGVPVRVVTRDRAETILTDGAGVVRVDSTSPGVGGVRADPEEVRRALERTRAGPPEGEDAVDTTGVFAEVESTREWRTAGVWTGIRSNERHVIAFRRPASRSDLGTEVFLSGEVSFIRPEALERLRAVRAALAADPARRALVMAHHRGGEGTPDAEAKAVSERRAESLMGFLAQRPEVWERLYKAERWNIRPEIFRHILGALGYAVGAVDVSVRPALVAFQRDHPPLAQDGTLGPDSRIALFLAYMRLAGDGALPEGRFARPALSAEPWMGCGALNSGAPDAPEATVFTVESAGTVRLPCRLGELAPCLEAAAAAGPPPAEGPCAGARCGAYRDLVRRTDDRLWAGGQELHFEARDDRDGRTLAGLHFVVEGERPTQLVRGETDEKGRARVFVAAEGNYRVRARFRPPSRPSPAPVPVPAPVPAPFAPEPPLATPAPLPPAPVEPEPAPTPTPAAFAPTPALSPEPPPPSALAPAPAPRPTPSAPAPAPSPQPPPPPAPAPAPARAPGPAPAPPRSRTPSAPSGPGPGPDPDVDLDDLFDFLPPPPEPPDDERGDAPA